MPITSHLNKLKKKSLNTLKFIINSISALHVLLFSLSKISLSYIYLVIVSNIFISEKYLSYALLISIVSILKNSSIDNYEIFSN